jgi:hypothetical protein
MEPTLRNTSPRDDSGYFKAPLLEPGTYTVTVVARKL